MTIFDSTPPEAPEATSSLDPNAGNGAEPVPPTKMSNKRKRRIAALTIGFVILGLVIGWYLLNNRKPLTALPGLSSTTMPHYEMSIYGATKPLGVAVTDSGDRIYVTESDGTRAVRVYDHSGKQVGTLKPPASTGAAHTPVYVAINPTTQNVYVSDRFTSAIYVYDAEGKFLRTFAPKGNLDGGWAPLGLAFGSDGSLYATDVRTKSHRVLIFAPDGTLVRSIGTPGQMSFPNGIAVDSHGNIEVADSNNGRLIAFNVAGTIVATVGRGVGEGDLGLPRGVAVDDSERLLVVDTSDHMVRVYTVGSSSAPTPSYIGSFGGEGQLDGTFEFPNGIATDKRAHIYVTDRENNRVQVWGY
jgi:DNA-binding beta-propeller fold protein YncE